MRAILIGFIFLTTLLGGCSTAPKMKVNPYEVQVQLYKEQLIARQEERAMYASMAVGCQADSCRTQIALTAALGTGGGGSNQPAPPVYVEQPSFGKQLALGLLQQLPVLGQIYLGKVQSDNGVKISTSQNQMIGGVVRDVTNTVAGMQPNVHIEGGYIGGGVSGNGAGIGNTFAVSGNGNAIGDGNALDNSTGQINGNWNNNSGRAFSPGPYTGFNGGTCNGGTSDGTTAGGAGGNCPGGGTGR